MGVVCCGGVGGAVGGVYCRRAFSCHSDGIGQHSGRRGACGVGAVRVAVVEWVGVEW